MTISAGALLLMEGGAMGTSVLETRVPGAFVVDPSSLAAELQPNAPLQANRWNYIIIYESGDAGADAQSLADGRVTGGDVSPKSVRPKALFHAVIDGPQSGNGTVDGKLEVGENWKAQSAEVFGAPFASWPDNRSYTQSPYNNAVGICLTTDFDRGPSEAQHKQLIQSVREIQQLTNIPSDHVVFQWDCRFAKPATQIQLAYAARFHEELANPGQ
jgi:hypothetical protein